jgi:hypothetical protein
LADRKRRKRQRQQDARIADWVRTHWVQVSGQGDVLVTFNLEDLYRSENSVRDHIVSVQGDGKVYTAITRKRVVYSDFVRTAMGK